MKSLSEIKADLSFIKGYAVAVFGSYAERRADRHSDIDIAIITREKNRKRCFEIWKDLLGKAPEVYDIKIFELLPLRIKASVLQRYEVVFGNRLDISEYFYNFRKLWKFELQKLADELDITIHICHFPPGTSKWNKIEHCLFSFITMNWRGKPLIDHATIVNLISATKNKAGLEVRCLLDTKKYLKGIKISDEQMAQLNILPDAFHGEWNYTIAPRNIKQ